MSICPGPPTHSSSGVKHEERHQRQPEYRHRIADEGHDAHDVIDPCVALYRGDDARRYAKTGADQDAEDRKFERRRKEPRDVRRDRPVRHHRGAQIETDDVPDIGAELHDHRLVEAHFPEHPVVDVLRRLIADDGQDRVDRHHPPDEERQRDKAEQRQRHGQQHRRAATGHAPGAARYDCAAAGAGCGGHDGSDDARGGRPAGAGRPGFSGRGYFVTRQ